MANMADNTYLFYGDRTELVKCHNALNELYEEVGSNIICVDRAAENVVVNCEWIDYIDELGEGDESFKMYTNSKWYGNPIYWNEWVKANFPKLSVAFMCEECGMEIFEKVDPDNKFDEYIYIHGSSIPEEDIERLPQVLKDAMCEDCVFGTFLKDEVFNSEFQPSDLPECITYREYDHTTYDEIRAIDETYLAKWSGYTKQFQNGVLAKTFVSDMHDSYMTDVNDYIDKWKEKEATKNS